MRIGGISHGLAESDDELDIITRHATIRPNIQLTSALYMSDGKKYLYDSIPKFLISYDSNVSLTVPYNNKATLKVEDNVINIEQIKTSYASAARYIIEISTEECINLSAADMGNTADYTISNMGSCYLVSRNGKQISGKKSVYYLTDKPGENYMVFIHHGINKYNNDVLEILPRYSAQMIYKVITCLNKRDLDILQKYAQKMRISEVYVPFDYFINKDSFHAKMSILRRNIPYLEQSIDPNNDNHNDALDSIIYGLLLFIV